MSEPFSPEPTDQLGDFQILRELGRGGMGTVYEAIQVSLHRKVALKVLSGGLGLTRTAVARFHREAEAAARLHHTNIVPIYSTGEDRGTHYYAMEMVEGPSLKQVIEHLQHGDLATGKETNPTEGKEDPATEVPDWVAETIAYERVIVGTGSSGITSDSSLQSGQDYFETVARMMADVADALEHAHSRGVIHRDIKPSNLLLSREGRLSINDFGLARILDQPGVTLTGEFVGSPLYMSPEQIAAGRVPVDHRTDIYSVGATLYELLTLRPPFPGRQREQVIAQILQKDVKPPRRVSRRVPIDLDTICLKALEKDPDRRYQTASEMAEDLRLYADGYTIKARRPHMARRIVKFIRRNKTAVAVTAVVIAMAVVAAFAMWSAVVRQEELIAEQTARERERVVREKLVPVIKDRIASGRIVAAFVAALQARDVLPDDPTINELWSMVSLPTHVRTQPSGVRVTVSDWQHLEDMWSLPELTPIEDIRVPQGYLRWVFSKNGHLTVETLRNVAANGVVTVSLDSELDLQKYGVRPEMVRVTQGMARSIDKIAIEEDFFIDKFEVSNEEYQRFVESGGYEEPKWWSDQSYEEDGTKLNWQTAVRRFVDRTGKPGPAVWSNGIFPDGEESRPARGVSWHEAVAYANFVGKQLPTVYHWDRAATLNAAAQIAPMSNFAGKGTAPRRCYRGIGEFGAYDMAGNVKEWCWNEMESGRRCTRGGSWDEQSYMFVQPDAVASLDRPENVGFRCVKYLATPRRVLFDTKTRPFFDYSQATPAPRAEVDAFKALYTIDSAVPLEPIVVSSESTVNWSYEIISVNSAHRPGRLVLHLFLPKVQTTECEAVVYCPGAGSFNRSSFRDVFNTGDAKSLALVENGRVVCWPIYMDMYERQGESKKSKVNLDRQRHMDVARDARRAVDYLQTRDGIDPNRIGFVGFSWGGAVAPIVIAVEPRFKVCVMIAAGLHGHRRLPEVDPFNFAPDVGVPVLMLNGRYDYIFPVAISQDPLYRAIGSQDKKLIRYESGHAVPWDQAQKAADEWLDKHLKPVE